MRGVHSVLAGNGCDEVLVGYSVGCGGMVWALDCHHRDLIGSRYAVPKWGCARGRALSQSSSRRLGALSGCRPRRLAVHQPPATGLSCAGRDRPPADNRRLARTQRNRRVLRWSAQKTGTQVQRTPNTRSGVRAGRHPPSGATPRLPVGDDTRVLSQHRPGTRLTVTFLAI
jgi:hypothetical protein